MGQREVFIAGRCGGHGDEELTKRPDATCLEGALKIKEVSYMHSEGVSVHETHTSRV